MVPFWEGLVVDGGVGDGRAVATVVWARSVRYLASRSTYFWADLKILRRTSCGRRRRGWSCVGEERLLACVWVEWKGSDVLGGDGSPDLMLMLTFVPL